MSEFNPEAARKAYHKLGNALVRLVDETYGLKGEELDFLLEATIIVSDNLEKVKEEFRKNKEKQI